MKKKRNLLILLIVLLALSSCAIEQTSPSSVFNGHYIEMWAQSLEPYSVDYAFYGDSRVVLADWTAAYPDSDVVNLGIGGDIVEGTIERLPLLEALDVKYCFLAIGVNNCSRNDFSEKSFEASYRELLDGLTDLGITVYVQTIAGVTTAHSTFDSAFVEKMSGNIIIANEVIEELAESRDMTIIDMATKMNNVDHTLKSEYSADGIHFTSAGNELWFDSLRSFIE